MKSPAERTHVFHAAGKILISSCGCLLVSFIFLQFWPLALARSKMSLQPSHQMETFSPSKRGFWVFQSTDV